MPFCSGGPALKALGGQIIRRLQVLHRVSSSLLGPVDTSFRALSGGLKFTVRRPKFNKDYLRGQIKNLKRCLSLFGLSNLVSPGAFPQQS